MSTAGVPASPTESTHALLAQTWGRWGQLDPHVISHLVNPSLMGGPRWPGMRQAYRVAVNVQAVLIASDGLADPFDPGEGPDDENGLGLELFAVTDDPVARPAAGVEGVARYGGTWLHDLVLQASQLAADTGRIGELMDDLGILSTELYDVGIPEAYAPSLVNAEGRVGVLLTLAGPPLPPRVNGPLGAIRLVHLQLLTAAEVAFAAEGAQARAELVRRLGQQGIAPLSRLSRESVVTG